MDIGLCIIIINITKKEVAINDTRLFSVEKYLSYKKEAFGMVI